MSQHLPVRLSAFGAVIEFTCPDAALREGCLRLVPGCWGPAPEGVPDVRYSIEPHGDGTPQEPLYQCRENGLLLGDRRTAQQVSTLLAGRMDYHLGEQARTCAFIHAGVVLHQGRALLFPGRTHAGKSTLTAALVEAGAEYVSDDVAVIDPAGQVHFLSRPITLRADVAGAHPSPATADPPGFRPGTAPVGAILILTYAAGTRGLDIHPMSRGEAVQQLMANSMNGRTRPEMVLTCCAAAASLALSARGVRGDAQVAGPAILSDFWSMRRSACTAG